MVDLGLGSAHLKLNKSSSVLSIGFKKSVMVDQYFEKLPGDLFDKDHYHEHRRQRRSY
jgi:hypothetical protein